MDSYLDANRTLWNHWARLHAGSDFYDLEGFKAGRSSLQDIEREALGEVAGRSLLHLQCHFGMDTLSWAREGASATGVDFSDEAITLARSLSAELGIPARFVCSDLYALPGVLDEQFDVVFTSYGVLPWLRDLSAWGQIVARYLKPGGTFYIVEFHPVMAMLDDTGDRFAYPYFPTSEPLRFEEQGSYAAGSDTTLVQYEWPYTLGMVVSALIEAGLTIVGFREYPYSPYNCWPFLEEDAPGRYVWKGRPGFIPLLFSIKATKSI
jgi:ubiquinone/menaquinone biosynthesis C-methylase UbiE